MHVCVVMKKLWRMRIFCVASAMAVVAISACSGPEGDHRSGKRSGGGDDAVIAATPAKGAVVGESVSSGLEAGSAADARQKNEVADIMRTALSFGESYDRLARLAKAGNAQAAFKLYENAFRCQNVDLRRETFESEIAGGSAPHAKLMAARILVDKRFCAGAKQAQTDSAQDWAVTAARLGHTEAQVMFFGAATAKFDTPEKIVAGAEELVQLKAEAIVHLRSAALKGHRTALFNLANAYHDGTLVRPDPVIAYGYMLALSRRGEAQHVQDHLALWSRGMTPDQIRRAQAWSLAWDRQQGAGQ